MNSFFQMLDLQMTLLIYVFCGFLCGKLKIITEENQQQFINFVLSILMPFMVFNSFKSITAKLLTDSVIILAISLAICMCSSLLGKMVYKRYPAEKASVFRYATLINNAGFAGLPLAQEAFGNEGLSYASIFLIPIRIFMWSSGVTLLSNKKVSVKELILKLLKNPCIIAVFLGIARGLLQISFSGFIENGIERLSSCVSPMSMIIIGAIIAKVNVKTLFERGVVLYTSLRLVIIPLVVFGFCKMLGVDAIITGTSMILTAMPAATSTALLASRYNADVELASKIVFVTTLLSLITAPLLMLLL